MIDALCSQSQIVIPALITINGASITVILWWIKRYINDQKEAFRNISIKLDESLAAYAECQRMIPEKYFSKAEFTQFITVRTTEHSCINNRLHSMENQQTALISKMEAFLDDTTKKIEWLSNTFIQKEGEVNRRIDRLADKLTRDVIQ